jgi:sec-independent protein translocase protein TatB
MFGIGSTEILIICVVALLVIGPQKLPGFLRTLGKGLAEFKRMSSDVKSTLDQEIQRADAEEREKEAKRTTQKTRKEAREAGDNTAERAPEVTPEAELAPAEPAPGVEIVQAATSSEKAGANEGDSASPEASEQKTSAGDKA